MLGGAARTGRREHTSRGMKDMEVAPDEPRNIRGPGGRQVAGNQIIDFFEMYGALGMDWLITNVGAADVTVIVDYETTHICTPRRTIGDSNVKWIRLNITATDIYDLSTTGIKR